MKVSNIVNIAVSTMLCVSTDDGTLYSFGSDYYGCLAQDADQVLSPAPVTHFDYAVSQVSAGDCHVVILTVCGKVLSWGSGEFGECLLSSASSFIFDLYLYR